MMGFKFKVVFCVISMLAVNCVSSGRTLNDTLKSGEKVVLDRRKLATEQQQPQFVTSNSDSMAKAPPSLLNADCYKNGSILLTLRTNDVFVGAMYSRLFPSSSCKVVGDGTKKITKLMLINSKKCGVISSRSLNYNFRVSRYNGKISALGLCVFLKHLALCNLISVKSSSEEKQQIATAFHYEDN